VYADDGNDGDWMARYGVSGEFERQSLGLSGEH
jgi:hypothetical protein